MRASPGRPGGAGPELVLKLCRPAHVWATAPFQLAYRGLSQLTALRHAGPAHRFLAIAWAPGAPGRQLGTQEAIAAVDKAAALLALAEGLLSRYALAAPARGALGRTLHAH